MTSIVNDNSAIDGIGLENHTQSPVPLKDDHEMEDKNPDEDLNESATRLPRLPSAHLSRVSVPDNLPSEETNNGEPNPGPEEPPEVTDPAVLITELLESEDSGKNDSDADGEIGSSVDEDDAVHPEIVRQITTETTDTVDDEALWDTDLEMDDDGDEHDPTGRVQYRGLCDELGVVPISYFMRHITEPNITMRYHALGPTGAKAIALVLRDNVTLERLNIDGNCIGGEGGRAIARMLEENDYITEMSLAGNKLGSLGAECVCKMLHMNTGLRKISLAENNLTDLDTNMFVECLEHNKYLRDLDLSKNRFGQEAGEIFGPAIASNDILERLDLSWNHLRLKGGIAVARGLQENVRLKTFRVAWNGLGPECGGPLAEAVATNNSLHELDISGNRLDIAAALAMAKSLLSNDEIKILRMGNNLITTAGAIALATAVNNNESSSLEVLDLTDVPVEFEFLRVVEDIRMKRPDFKVLHGPVLRSGNTPQDIGKPAIDPYKRNEPVLVLEEHIVVNDMRLLEILKRYDPDNTYSVSPAEFISALDELAVPYNRKNLEIALENIPRGESGKIFFGDFYDQENRPLSSRATAEPETDVPEQ